jgi:hypothetical protein
VHTYRSLVPDGQLADPPPIQSTPFHDALDLVRRAEVDPVIGWATWPEVWHLDHRGIFRCYFKASSFHSLVSWMEDPEPLLRSRREGLAHGGCADFWVVVDSRPTWIHDPPNEADVRALREVRLALAAVGVSMLDCVVFDDQHHWWSIQEMSNGLTQWQFSAAA